jgi:hypothetical protein
MFLWCPALNVDLVESPATGNWKQAVPGDYHTAEKMRGDYHNAENLQGDYHTAENMRGDYHNAENLQGDYHTAENMRGDYHNAENLQGDYHTAENMRGDYHNAENLQGDFHTAESNTGTSQPESDLEEGEILSDSEPTVTTAHRSAEHDNVIAGLVDDDNSRGNDDVSESSDTDDDAMDAARSSSSSSSSSSSTGSGHGNNIVVRLRTDSLHTALERIGASLSEGNQQETVKSTNVQRNRSLNSIHVRSSSLSQQPSAPTKSPTLVDPATTLPSLRSYATKSRLQAIEARIRLAAKVAGGLPAALKHPHYAGHFQLVTLRSDVTFLSKLWAHCPVDAVTGAFVLTSSLQVRSVIINNDKNLVIGTSAWAMMHWVKTC